MDVSILSEAETLHSREYEWKQELEYHCLNFCVLLLLENMNISGLNSEVIPSQTMSAATQHLGFRARWNAVISSPQVLAIFISKRGPRTHRLFFVGLRLAQVRHF